MSFAETHSPCQNICGSIGPRSLAGPINSWCAPRHNREAGALRFVRHNDSQFLAAGLGSPRQSDRYLPISAGRTEQKMEVPPQDWRHKQVPRTWSRLVRGSRQSSLLGDKRISLHNARSSFGARTALTAAHGTAGSVEAWGKICRPNPRSMCYPTGRQGLGLSNVNRLPFLTF